VSQFTKSNEEAIFAALTGSLAAEGIKVRIELGADEDARRGAPPRIVAVPQGRKYTHPAQQLHATMKVGQEKAPAFDFHCWGADYFQASVLEDAVVRALFNTLSPNAYELGDSAPPNYSDTPNEAKGWEIVVPVRLLRIPIPAVQFRRVTIQTITAPGAVTGPNGATPTSAGPTITLEEP
jgi:hypothetical protein